MRIKLPNSLINYATKNNLDKNINNTINFSYFGTILDN